jgi:hypothetical protein
MQKNRGHPIPTSKIFFPNSLSKELENDCASKIMTYLLFKVCLAKYVKLDLFGSTGFNVIRFS